MGSVSSSEGSEPSLPSAGATRAMRPNLDSVRAEGQHHPLTVTFRGSTGSSFASQRLAPDDLRDKCARAPRAELHPVPMVRQQEQ